MAESLLCSNHCILSIRACMRYCLHGLRKHRIKKPRIFAVKEIFINEKSNDVKNEKIMIRSHQAKREPTPKSRNV